MAKIIPNDKNYDGDVITKKLKTKATNEPEMDKTEGVGMPKDHSKPTGDADDALLGNK